MCACSFLAVDALFLPATLSSGLPSQPAAEAHDGAGKATPPPARRDDVVDDLHGVRVPDPYRWLEDQSSAETRAWIEKENEYSKPILSSLPGREDLRRRLTEFLKVDITSTPRASTGRYFFMKRPAGQDLFSIDVRQGLAGADQVLIDPAPMSADGSTSVSLEDVSRDGALLAYGVRQGGQDEVSIHLLDVDSRRNLTDELPVARYEGVALKADKTGLYYSRQTPEGPRVYYHALGTFAAGDVELFGKGYGPEKIIGVDVSQGGRYLIIHVYHGAAADRTEIYYQEIAQHGPLKPLVNDIAARFIGIAAGHQIFLETNWKAPNSRILAVDLDHPERERWREIIPESDAAIADFSLTGGKVIVNYTRDASSRLRIFDAVGGNGRDLELPALGSVAGISSRWEDEEAFFGFSSFYIPPTVYRYHVPSGRQEVWARTQAPIDASQFEVKQVWYESKDKVKVPMFLVYKKGLELNGSNPGLMTGYGGFNVSMTPGFSPQAVVWAEHGGVFALPNLRGGGEFGEKWHQAGMRDRKQSVFDDFVAAAEWLVANQYTQPSKLGVFGTSNGGLLVGSALTQRPDLFGAVVCRYPLLDMLRYQKFLVGSFWVPEYGSSEDAQQFKYLYAYSPYQHVEKGARYPAVLLVSGDGDTRVDPLHARKMTALLQWANSSDRPVLLDYDTKSGHSGGRPLSKQIDETTDELAFLFWQLH
ncbi:MAG TPA: prolyl oligopeptidase family serine peptidase [Terriglobia bacterium]|nr:prolyl oligopeptidase family serine peptidase [Terriglobia bacterium]